MFKFLISCFLICKVSLLNAVIVCQPIELKLSIEDAEMRHGLVTAVFFNEEEVDLKPKTFMNRVLHKDYHLMPGKYSLTWVVEKQETSWDQKVIKKQQRLIELESSDAVVHIAIRGESLSIY